jgi:glyoxylase-like metal-dependent hydrolase (beta-lactamase superfamily II)
VETTAIELREELFQVQVAMPFPERFTNAYVSRRRVNGAIRWQILDPGFYDEHTEETWRAALDELGIGPGQVEAIYVSHFHTDHLAAAGWLQKETGAPVYVLDQEVPFAEASAAGRVFGGRGDRLRRRWFEALGVPLDNREAEQEVLSFRSYLRYAPVTLTPIAPHSRVPFGEEEAEVLWAPGHTNGQLVLYLPGRRELLAGDHILPKITPNTSRMPYGLLDPLGAYMRHLETLMLLPIVRIWPAHGVPLENGVQRIVEIYDHHIERAEQAWRLTAGDRSVFEVCLDLFAYRHLSKADWRLALGETLAHLEYLVALGWADRLVDGRRTFPTARLEQFLEDAGEATPRVTYEPRRR